LIALVAALGAAWVLWSECRDQFRGGTAPHSPGNAADRREFVDSIVERGPAAIPELLSLLGSSDVKVRRDALLGLERLGPEAGNGAAIDAVRLRLADEAPQIREYALVALARICEDQDEVIAAAAALLVDSNPEVRETAARRLEATGSRVIPKMTKLAGDERPLARQLAVRILKNADRHCDPDQVTAILASLLRDPTPEVRADAAGAVVARGAASVAEVRGWLRDGSPALRQHALLAVCILGPEAVEAAPELEELLDGDESPRLVFEALGSLKLAGREALPRLVRRANALADADRLQAAAALMEMGAEADQVLPLLGPLISGAGVNIRIEAADLLVRADLAEARRLSGSLQAQLEAEGKSIDRAVLSLLCALGPASSEAVPLLNRLISHEDVAVQSTAIHGLGKIGPAADPAVPELLRLLGSQGRVTPVTRPIVRALGGIGPAARPGAPQLLAILNHAGLALGHSMVARLPGSGIETDIAWALGRMGDHSPPVVAAVRRLLTADGALHIPHEIAGYRVTAVQSLALLDAGSPATESICLHALDDPSWALRTQAALAVAYLPCDWRQAVDPLTAALNDDESAVQTSAALALGRIGPDARRAVPLLHKLIRDHRNSVPNRFRLRIHSTRFLFVPDNADLGDLSVTAAARWALARIEPPAADDAPRIGGPHPPNARAR
jgi:HEAT repeat protein